MEREAESQGERICSSQSIRSPQDCFQDRPCNRIQEAFSSEPCLGYVLFNIVLRHGRREAESQGERICSSQSII